jgi:hypothetical protein
LFFRLSKNVVKNVYFDPFGGGYPPLPPQQPLYSPHLRFYRKIIKFHKKTFNNLYLFLFFIFWGGRGLPKAVSPPARTGGQHNVKRMRGEKMIERLLGCSIIFCIVVCAENNYTHFSVRTRNTLHEVGAPSLEERGTTRLAQGSVGSQKLWHIMRTSTSHFLFLNNFITFILLYHI